MKLTEQTVSQVKGCKGLYPLNDVASHFSLTRQTVKMIWAGSLYEEVPTSEAPIVKCSKVPEWLLEDVMILTKRNHTVKEIAQSLHVTSQGVTRAIRQMELVS
jgi:predicted transcriptional regulator